MPERAKNEITNAVLATKLDGFKELVDNKFRNVSETLDRIEKNSSGFATKIELEEVKKDFNSTIKRIEDAFVKHNEDDKTSFGNISKGQGELRDTLLKWGAVLGTILFALSFLSPVILKYYFHI